MFRPFRKGVVSKVDAENGMISVTYDQYDGATTALMPHNSHMDEFKIPEVGSEVDVMHFESGQAAGIVMGRHWNKKNKCPNMRQGVWRHELAPESKYGKCWMQYEEDKEQLTIHVPKKLVIEVGECPDHGEPGEILIQANGDSPKIEIQCNGKETATIDMQANGPSTEIDITSSGASALVNMLTKLFAITSDTTTNTGLYVGQKDVISESAISGAHHTHTGVHGETSPPH